MLETPWPLHCIFYGSHGLRWTFYMYFKKDKVHFILLPIPNLYQCAWMIMIDWFFCTTCLALHEHRERSICNLSRLNWSWHCICEPNMYLNECFQTDIVAEEIFRGFNKILISVLCILFTRALMCSLCSTISINTASWMLKRHVFEKT